MYFPKLIDLKDYDIPYEIIDKFDNWLASLRGPKRKRIRPARFAIDSRTEYDLSIEMFTIAAVRLHILQLNYEVNCPVCENELVNSYNTLDSIPANLRCDNGHIFEPHHHGEFIEITFDLINKPDPNSPKYKVIPTSTRKNIVSDTTPTFSPKKAVMNVSDFQKSIVGREEIEKLYFSPDWNAYDSAYDRFIQSFLPGVTTAEKGDSLEALSSLTLSFVTIFSADTTVKTLTNQIDVTVSLKPYHSIITFPILKVMQRRLLCECKNEDENVPSIWVDKLFAIISSKSDNCRVGIIFSRNPYSGDEMKFARASQIEHARKGYYIISINKSDFEYIKNNRPNVLEYLDKKLEALEVRISDRDDKIV